MAASGSINLNFSHLQGSQVTLPYETKVEIETTVQEIEQMRAALILANDNQPFFDNPALAESYYSITSGQMEAVIQRALPHLHPLPDYMDPISHAMMSKPTLHFCGDEPHIFNEDTLVVEPATQQIFCPETFAPLSQIQQHYALQEKIYQYALVMLGITTFAPVQEYTNPASSGAIAPAAPSLPPEMLIRLCELFEDTLTLMIIQNTYQPDALHAADAHACAGCTQGWLALPPEQQTETQQQVVRLGEALESLPQPLQEKLFLKVYERHLDDAFLAQRIPSQMSPVEAGNELFFENLHITLSILAETLMEEICYSQIPAL